MALFYALSLAILLTGLPALSGNLINPSNLTHFNELDDFSLMGIFDRLRLGDLSKLAAVNPRFRQIIIDHYIIAEQRLHEHVICIDLDEQVSMKSRISDDLPAHISDKLDEILLILQHFGGVFKALNIFIDQHGYKYAEQIQQAVNKYCSNAFVEVRLAIDHADKRFSLGDKVNISFLNATDIILIRFARSGVDPIRLDTAFPRMQKLHTNSEFDLNHHYPHLNETKLVSFYVAIDISKALQFFRLNPQLRSVESPLFNNDTYLTNLAESLPNLEAFTLKIPRSQFDNSLSLFPVAQFRHVKQFILTVDDVVAYSFNPNSLRQLLGSLEFCSLESFTVANKIDPTARDFIVELIVKNAALQNVTIDSEMPFECLARLIEPLRELKELTIRCDELSTCGIVKTFLEHVAASGHGLAKFTVKLPKYGRITYRDLLELIPNGWAYNKALASQNQEWLQLERSQ